MKLQKVKTVTAAQLNYINILANDLQLNIEGRNAHIKFHIGREINSVDELTVHEAGKVINYFKEMKENAKA